MNIIYIIPDERDAVQSRYPGVIKKIQNQINALSNANIACDLKYIGKQQTTLLGIVKRMPFGRDGLDWDAVLRSCDSNATALYIRKPYCISRDFIAFLKSWKQVSRDTRIILELPTYPYDAEYSSLKQKTILIKDKLHRRQLPQYVDRIVNFGNHQKIFGVTSLRAINGIDASSIKERAPSLQPNGDIHAMCVASFSKWHGIDRAIAGLKQYIAAHPERSIHLHLLGDGQSLSDLKAMVSDFELSKYVNFYGMCDSSTIDRVFDKCTLAIECLGIHRKDPSMVSSSLKSREYLAKGIPFVYSGVIDVFRNDPVDFCLQIPADESPVDFEKVVEFHDRLYVKYSEDQLIARIRNYAVENVGIDAAMKSVIDYIKEAGNE